LLLTGKLLDSLIEDDDIDKEKESRLIDGLNDEDFEKSNEYKFIAFSFFTSVS